MERWGRWETRGIEEMEVGAESSMKGGDESEGGKEEEAEENMIGLEGKEGVNEERGGRGVGKGVEKGAGGG